MPNQTFTQDEFAQRTEDNITTVANVTDILLDRMKALEKRFDEHEQLSRIINNKPLLKSLISDSIKEAVEEKKLRLKNQR